MIERLDSTHRAQIEELAAYRTQLIREIDWTSGGIGWCAEHTTIVDQTISLLYRALQERYQPAPRIAVIATGGYGRRELAPFSDIDLTVVPLNEASPALDEALKWFFRVLHETLGSVFRFEIGYAYRLIADMPGIDPKTRTGLLDARLVCGSRRVFADLMSAFWASLPGGEFVLDKIEERSDAMARFHDTPLVVEPHLKEGAGGLRSFQCANWIRAAIGERSARPTKEYDTILKVRNLLHQVARRRLDHLNQGRQLEVAESVAISQRELMDALHESMIYGANQYDEASSRILEARFNLAPSVIAVAGEARLESPADPGDVAVGVSIATRLGLSVSTLKTSYLPSVNGPAALYAIAMGEPTLRNLDRCGALQELLPELTATRKYLPADLAHTYTVFEHTMRLVRKIDQAGQCTWTKDLIDSIGDTSPLYLAALIHDVGKPLADAEGADHSDVGGRIARAICNRWSLSGPITETVVWLVEHHLTMSLFMRMRDLQNPATISEFATIVQNSERLYLLALLTWADISAVSDEAFTPAQESFLRELVARTYGVLEQETPTEIEPVGAKRRLLRELAKEDVTEALLEDFLDDLPVHYLVSSSPASVKLHFGFARRARQGQITLDLSHRPELSASEITLCARDHPGLLSEILGVLYAYDLSLLGLRAATTSGEQPVAIDLFTVSFGGKPIPTGTWRHVSASLNAVLNGETSVQEVLLKRGKDPSRKQVVARYALLEGNPSIVEVQAPRGRGLAFRLTKVLAEQGLDISSARVGQWAGAAGAAIYLNPVVGPPSLSERVHDALSGSVESSLRDSHSSSH